MAKNLQSLLAWLGIVLAQWVAANLCVFLFSMLWYTDRPATLSQFLIIVAFIAAGFLIGVYGAGILILRRSMPANLKAGPRLLATLLGIAIPLLVLAVLGWKITPARQPEFQMVVVGEWQPALAQIALWLSILGFHLPSSFKRRPSPLPGLAQESG